MGPPPPLNKRSIPSNAVQAGLGLGVPPMPQPPASMVCPPATSSCQAPQQEGEIFCAPQAPIKIPPPVETAPAREGVIQTTVRNPKTIAEERRAFVRCTGPCCDPAAAASLAQQQMALQMHLMQQQQQAMAAQAAGGYLLFDTFFTKCYFFNMITF